MSDIVFKSAVEVGIITILILQMTNLVLKRGNSLVKVIYPISGGVEIPSDLHETRYAHLDMSFKRMAVLCS